MQIETEMSRAEALWVVQLAALVDKGALTAQEQTTAQQVAALATGHTPSRAEVLSVGNALDLWGAGIVGRGVRPYARSAPAVVAAVREREAAARAFLAEWETPRPVLLRSLTVLADTNLGE